MLHSVTKKSEKRILICIYIYTHTYIYTDLHTKHGAAQHCHYDHYSLSSAITTRARLDPSVMSAQSLPSKQWRVAAATFDQTVSQLALYCENVVTRTVQGFCNEEQLPAESFGETKRRLHEQNTEMIKSVHRTDIANSKLEGLGLYTISAAAVPSFNIKMQSGRLHIIIFIKIYVAMLDGDKRYRTRGLQVVHHGICKRRILGQSILIKDDRVSTYDLPIEDGMENLDYEYNAWQTVNFDTETPEESETRGSIAKSAQASIAAHTSSYDGRQVPPPCGSGWTSQPSLHLNSSYAGTPVTYLPYWPDGSLPPYSFTGPSQDLGPQDLWGSFDTAFDASDLGQHGRY
jgi:hypothetical protein